MPAIAIGMAVSGMAAQNIGAQRWDRVGGIAVSAVVMNLIVTSLLVALTVAFGPRMVALFLPGGTQAVAIGAYINLLAGWSFVPLAVTTVLISILRANGATTAPLLITVAAFLLVRLGFAHGLSPGLGADAIWWSFPAGALASVVMAYACYRVLCGPRLLSRRLAEAKA